MKLNKLALTIVMPLLLVVSQQASAQGIPVYDNAAVIAQMQQLAQWTKQLADMKTQIDQQKQLYSSLNGNKGMGALMNNPSLMRSLPPDWQKVYSSVRTGGYSGLTGNAKAMRDGTMIYSCGNQPQGVQRSRCERELNKGSQDQAYVQSAYSQAEGRLDNIQALMNQINSAQDSKAIADLGARIASENAMIQNEGTKLQLFKMISDNEDRAIAQEKREVDLERVNRTERVAKSLKPLQY